MAARRRGGRSARAQQRRVEDLGPVRRGEHDHAAARVEAVHLGEDLVQRLLALVVAAGDVRAAGRSRAADRVELVDEDDRGRGGLGLLEQIAHARGADPDDHLDELRGRHLEERNARLAGDRAGQQRLAGSGRAAEQDAARDPAAEPQVLVGVLEEVDDLGELVLGLVDPRHVGERHRLLGGLHPPCARAPEGHQARRRRRRHRPRAASAHTNSATSSSVGPKPKIRLVEERGAGVGVVGVDRDVVVLEQRRQLVAVGERRDLCGEVLGGLDAVLVGRVLDRRLKVPWIEPLVEEISVTLPALICARNVGCRGSARAGWASGPGRRSTGSAPARRRSSAAMIHRWLRLGPGGPWLRAVGPCAAASPASPAPGPARSRGFVGSRQRRAGSSLIH